ncbi:hypothetical protein BJ165DRAFT_765930 [Panaeolus papilionaceus]|nr:hypothetical protein BJ165DRAFT_765930 [Panaeolus papilionaceus]
MRRMNPGGIVQRVTVHQSVNQQQELWRDAAHSLIGRSGNDKFEDTGGPKEDGATDPQISVPDQVKSNPNTVALLSPTSHVGEKREDDHDIIIAVMGPTGVGKTSFIQSLTASYQTDRAHHDLSSGTQSVETETITLPGVGRIVLVDTPGFDDSNRSDAVVLTIIAEWLTTTYRNGRLLNGLIYLHRISDIRFDAGTSSTLNLTRKIYGGTGFQRLALVTTMWSDIHKDAIAAAGLKEDELMKNAWATFLQRKDRALVARYDCTTRDSGQTTAQLVVSGLLQQAMAHDEIKTQMEEEVGVLHRTGPHGKIVLQLQKEIVDKNIALPRTTAGRAAFTLTETAKYYLKQATS